MKIETIQKQAKTIIEKLGINVPYPETLPLLPDKTEGYFLIPKWNKLALTYGEALQKVLDAIKSTRPFYNYREGKLGPEYLRELPNKNIPEILACQLGNLHKGQSVDTVRKNKADNEILLGAYEVAIILLTHTDILKSYDDLYLDCPGDEASPGADGDFSHAPSFHWYDGRLRFGFGWTVYADDGFGSVSGFVSQPLESRSLDSIESLTLESAIKIVKKEGYKVIKEM